MYCPICGTRCEESLAFCPNCGHPLHRPSPSEPPRQEPTLHHTASQPTGELPGKVMGILGMVLGILSILFGCCLPVIPLLCAIAGLVLSCISRKKANEVLRKNNFALAGLICSIIGLVFSVLYLLIFISILLQEYV